MLNGLGRRQVAVDLTDIIATYSAWPSMWIYYLYYPLKEMIGDLYRLKSSPGFDELFFETLRERLPAAIDMNDLILHSFIESLGVSLDHVVNQALGITLLDRTYIVIRWLEGNSILLEVTQNEMSIGDRYNS